MGWLLWTALALAAPYRTGHHHAEFDWYTIDTRFFRVHYPVSRSGRPVYSERSAIELAQVADELLLKLGAQTDTVWKSPIHIVVSDEADEMSAYTLPHWRFIVLSPDPGSDVLRLRGRSPEGWLTEALAHELGHVVAHRTASVFAPSASYGVEGQSAIDLGRAQVGAGIVFGPSEPYGWSEGAAEFWASRLGIAEPSAGRAAMLHTSALSGRLLTWDEWLVSEDKGDLLDAERAYQQGSAFAAWLAQRYGRDIFLEVARGSGRRYPLSWASRFRKATGSPARVLWAQWRAELTADAIARDVKRRSLGLTEGLELERWRAPRPGDDLSARDRWLTRSERDREEVLESTGSFELYPRTSPDGRWVAEGKVGWVHVWRGRPEDLLAQTPRGADGSRTERRDRVAASTSVWIPSRFGMPVSFVPGRDALVLAAPEDVRRHRLSPSPRDPLQQLYLVDLTPSARKPRRKDASEEHLRWSHRESRRRMSPIEGTLRARDPAVSPDGERLAFLAYQDGTTNLVVSRLDGSSPRALSSFAGGEWLQHPSWSPDGEQIVVSLSAPRGEGRGQRRDLFVVDVQTGLWRPLTDTPEDEIDAVWTDDGIWFSSEVDGTSEILLLDPRDGQLLQQTRTAGGAHTPWPMPGGDLLYSAVTAYGWKVKLLPASERLHLPIPSSQSTPEAPAPKQPPPPRLPLAPRPYRSARSVLVPGVSPLLRIDGNAEQIRPLGGAYLRIRDAVERFDLQMSGLLGEDFDGGTTFTWRGLPPELSLFASGSLDTRGIANTFDPWSFGTVGLAAEQRLRDEISLSLQLERWSTSDTFGPRVRSARLTAALSAGDLPLREDNRAFAADLALTQSWSSTREGDGSWQRLVLDLSGIAPLWPAGPLTEQRTRAEWSLLLGATDRSVAADEKLYAGGDLPSAYRLGIGPISAPLPGAAAYALGSPTLGVAHATWLLPLAVRLRSSIGPLYLQSVDLGVGIGGAVGTPRQWIAEGDAEIRLKALLFDTPWDGLLRIASSAGDLEGSPLGDRVPAPALGPRLMIGLGTGF